MANGTKQASEPIIDWNPAPGYVLCKPLKREEVAALYSKQSSRSLDLPDNMGKVSDSVGIGRVIKKGLPLNDDFRLGLLRLQIDGKLSKAEVDKEFALNTPQCEVGDLVGFLPYTDKLIEIDGVKYSVVAYKNIQIVRSTK